jgi:hypothetical protein
MEEDDRHKIEQFIRDANVSVAVGYPDMTFQACDKWWDGEYQLADKDSSVLVRCRECGGLWFMGNEGSYVCQCCGEYDGDGHLVESIDGNGNDKWYGSSSVLESARLKAKQARFEYGETPNKNLGQKRVVPIAKDEAGETSCQEEEEDLIRFLLNHDRDVILETGTVHPEDFSSPALGRIFDVIRDRTYQGKLSGVKSLEGILSAEEIMYLNKIIYGKSVSSEDHRRVMEFIAKNKRSEEFTDGNDALAKAAVQKRDLEWKEAIWKALSSL